MFYRSLIVLCFLLLSSYISAAPVNINQANADTIAKSLNGIGPGKAAAIVQFRNDNGPFKTIDELKYVKGIGKKTLEKIRVDVNIISEMD